MEAVLDVTGALFVAGMLRKNRRVWQPEAQGKSLRADFARHKIRNLEGNHRLPSASSYEAELSFHAAIDLAEFKHYRITYMKQSVDSHNHIDGIEDYMASP